MAYPEIRSWFHMEAQDIPPVLRDLIENILPPENVDAWLADTKAFPDGSPLDLLSKRHDRQDERPLLVENVRRIVVGIYSTLAFITVPYVPSVEAVTQAVEQAQERVIKRDVDPGCGSRFYGRSKSPLSPAKLFFGAAA